jgi:predicted aspartyl protease
MKFTHVCFLIVIGTITNAFRIDIYGQRDALTTASKNSRRAVITGTQLSNSADISYYANLLLGGKTFQLLVDTGRFAQPFYFLPEIS